MDMNAIDAKEQIKLVAEAVKLIIATSSGFLIAFSAEPIKLYATGLHRKNALRFALYKEILIFLDAVQLFLKYSIEGENISMNHSFPSTTFVYDHAMVEPMIFYNLKEAIQIQRIYMDLKLLLNVIEKSDADKKVVLLMAETILKRSSMILKDKRFNRKILRSATKQLALHIK
jgi:hypothetical protein